MNGGAGASRRHADYMLATGQWAYSNAHGAPLSGDQEQWLRDRRERLAHEAAVADKAIRPLVDDFVQRAHLGVGACL